MEKTDNMPLWVFLAFSSISSRKGAVILTSVCALFTLYCLPWSLYSSASWVAKLFLIDSWDWFPMMLPMTAWYWLSMRWIDNNHHWQQGESDAQVVDR
jgi:hypothetical protein